MNGKEEWIGRVLSRNVEEVIDRGHLRAALMSGKKLRVKHGIDPTGPKIHIGRAVVLWKLREFQDLGHRIVLIIGDFTAQIGDPSDKLEKRPFLSKEQIRENLKNYLPQIGKVLDLEKTEIRYNSEWLAKLNLRDFSELADLFTFQQILERRNFHDRWQKHKEISYREGMYPLLQGYDSVAVKADVELGGTDQLFNVLAGRKVQERYGQRPQDVMATKMVIGLDGRKMSTSWGNVINILDEPADQFGKVMSLRDELIPEYFEAATDLPEDEIAGMKKGLKKGDNPKIAKSRLAFEIVKRYHGESAARKAQENFEKVFARHEVPDDMPVLKLSVHDTAKAKDIVTALDVVISSGVLKSKSEARRLIKQGGFEFNEKTIKDPLEELPVRGGEIVRVGKKRFFRTA
ncbi:MAG TPA: tyrosine--tRNA ligase [Candidatus Paceibacterota bacterium]|nr:tyrosine--tRNA ligase [Candidatus Paceibacterota bacterium]